MGKLDWLFQKLTALWESGTPTSWSKVHDLPDYVRFEHKRHVKAGVQCTECHGQIKLQGKKTRVPGAEGRNSRLAESGNADATLEPTEIVEEVVKREATMQMGWCLDCHASHPTIEQNYGENANLRKAELKDCLTCHN